MSHFLRCHSNSLSELKGMLHIFIVFWSLLLSKERVTSGARPKLQTTTRRLVAISRNQNGHRKERPPSSEIIGLFPCHGTSNLTRRSTVQSTCKIDVESCHLIGHWPNAQRGSESWRCPTVPMQGPRTSNLTVNGMFQIRGDLRKWNRRTTERGGCFVIERRTAQNKNAFGPRCPCWWCARVN